MDKALRLKGLFLFVLAIIGTSPMPSYAQQSTHFLQQILATAPAGVISGTYTFVAYTFVVEGGTFPSPSLTLTAGDFVVVFASEAGTASTTLTVTSTPSNTWASTPLVFNATTGAVQQLYYTLSAGSGSTTFTFTAGGTGAAGFKSLIVLQYHHSGNAAAFDTSSQGSSSSPPITSGSFTTAGQDLVIMCNRAGGSSTTYTAGTIAGSSATLRGVSAATTGTASDAGCEDVNLAASHSGATGTLSYSSSGSTAYSLAAFE